LSALSAAGPGGKGKRKEKENTEERKAKKKEKKRRKRIGPAMLIPFRAVRRQHSHGGPDSVTSLAPK
jgi:hypothetical protein